jgi:hypothetical protein
MIMLPFEGDFVLTAALSKALLLAAADKIKDRPTLARLDRH